MCGRSFSAARRGVAGCRRRHGPQVDVVVPERVDLVGVAVAKGVMMIVVVDVMLLVRIVDVVIVVRSDRRQRRRRWGRIFDPSAGARSR